MSNNLKQRYKVNRDAVEQAFSNQLGLKRNEEYEAWADNACIKITEYFLKKYNKVNIELPKIREKSSKSLLGKIKNLQIERLSKLYAIEGLNDSDKRDLYLRIKERILEAPNLDTNEILNEIKKLIYVSIDKIDIEELQRTIMVDGISKSTKTALLRILVGKIENSEIPNKEEKLESIDKKYGKKAAIQSGLEENDIIRYDSVRCIKKDKEKIQRLRDESRFLKANDLRGMKIVVVDVADELKTKNNKITELLEKRKGINDNKERIILTHQIISEIGQEFYNDLANDEEFLKELKARVIPGSNKHKKKSNGYEAEHIKFVNIDEPQYTLELQFKSEYVETLCKGEGSASHENRPGKARVLPKFSNDEELIKKLEFMVPKYKIIKRENGYIVIKKFSLLKNIMAYFQQQIIPGSEEYEKVMDLFMQNNNENTKVG